MESIIDRIVISMMQKRNGEGVYYAWESFKTVDYVVVMNAIRLCYKNYERLT